MTREEAKEVFINRGYVNVKGGTIFDGDKWRQSVEVITEWLKEQHCGDAISRQAAIGIIQNWLNSDTGYSCGEKNVMKCTIDELSALPSVSTEKTGWWILTDKKEEIYCHVAICSVCGKESINEGVDDYCSWCGAKMEVWE